MANTLSSPQLAVVAGPAHRLPTNSPAETSAAFQAAFGVPFSILDATTGDLLHMAPDQPARDWIVRGELARTVGRLGRPEIVETGGPLVTLAVPIVTSLSSDFVAIATLVAEPLSESTSELKAAAELVGLDADDTREWIGRQTPCPVETLRRIADLLCEKFDARRRLNRLEQETATLTDQMAATFEEVSLLYCLIQNLRIAADDDQLARLALEWLGNVAPSQGLALHWSPVEASSSVTATESNRVSFITRGQCPLDEQGFSRLIADCGLNLENGPYLANSPATSTSSWLYPSIRNLIVVPIASAGRRFGWLAAFNRSGADGFRQVDVNLFGSVATILGVHRENTELFHEQTEFVAGIVHALTSAIEAKDPYTCGHSDRVARMSVRLGQELGCSSDELKTLYLAGLLHDVGKIGVEDEVLHKVDDLSVEEFNHIKRHPRIGCEILADLKNLKHVLPIVLHHHESWDGSGYPAGLAGEKIPRLARIIAVADAFDAMASDRPYRPGMRVEVLEEVLRQGSGIQWDPEVVTAYFQVRTELIAMVHPESDAAPLNVPSWT